MVSHLSSMIEYKCENLIDTIQVKGSDAGVWEQGWF